MVILDENVIHAGTESMTCGYAPVHSPRYFSYVRSKHDFVKNDATYNKFYFCGSKCKFCTNSGVLEISEKLKNTFSILNSSGLALGAKNYTTDWIAGDLKLLGWVVVRSGVSVPAQFETKLAHEFQTILCTKRMLQYSTKGTWRTINSFKNEENTIVPGTFREYYFSKPSKPTKTSSIVWGQRKMIPMLDNSLEPSKACGHTWFVEHGCPFIAKYFVELENNLLHKPYFVSSEVGNTIEKNYLSAILGLIDIDFNEYTLSGQCVIANFGFVQEQVLHTDYDPIEYD